MGDFLNRRATAPKDLIIECVAGLTIPIVIVPSIFFAVPEVIEALMPGSANTWSSLSPVLMFGIFLLADDLTQYWWHRMSHRLPRLYALHRAHHSARYMSVRIVYRNSLVYYALMPGLWLSAALIHFGFGSTYMVYIVCKMAVITGAHSSVAWDEPLLRHPITRRPMWWVRRIISTPMTHAAHHGRYEDDEATHYKGNYGNFLFLWDIIFGTAKINDRRPAEYGLEKVSPATWFQELIWPLGRSLEEDRQAADSDPDLRSRTHNSGV